MFFVKSLLKELLGTEAENIKGLVLTDCQDLFSCVHNIKACDDKKLLADIIGIRQAIHDDKVIHEVRYVPGKLMIADCLTKKTKSGEGLMTILRTGVYAIPGGAVIRDSTMLAVKTWAQLMKAEEGISS